MTVRELILELLQKDQSAAVVVDAANLCGRTALIDPSSQYEDHLQIDKDPFWHRVIIKKAKEARAEARKRGAK